MARPGATTGKSRIVAGAPSGMRGVVEFFPLLIPDEAAEAPHLNWQ